MSDSARLPAFVRKPRKDVSTLPIQYGLGGGYAAGAISGGFYFLLTSYRFAQAPSIANAQRNFLASLIQLTLLLTGALIDAGID